MNLLVMIILMKSFLPKQDPLRNYITQSRSLSKLEEIASELPKLLLTGNVQTLIEFIAKKCFLH
jgi:hypothetical protein